MEEQENSGERTSGSRTRVEQKEKRTSRACLTCRKRKSACYLQHINGIDVTPCQRCKATGQECVIGGSNRGGRRVRRKTTAELSSGSAVYTEGQHSPDHSTSPRASSSATAVHIDPALHPAGHGEDSYAGAGRTQDLSPGPRITFNDLQNPSDALGILAQIASNGDSATNYSLLRTARQPDPTTVNYHLVNNQSITISTIVELLRRYKIRYHPYFPLAPAATLDINNVASTARTEPHLLTAILVIAARDFTEDPKVFTACTEYMKSLVSSLAAGGPANVEAVEALLVLAEWTPYTSHSGAGSVGRGEEDREAWMHIGIALRIGYFLGLDKYSFPVRGDDAKDPQWQRKRLVWTACYIGDRQISIRLGRAFWSRGPGPLTTLRKEDFPMLTPASPSDDDFASIFQATLELTLLFSNVHDVLYSNPGNSLRSHLSGGYIKLIDDFRQALYGWKSVWGPLTCSPNLKATLLMSYDYLRLYTTAFAFHATVKRALPLIKDQNSRNSSQLSLGRVFYNNVGAVGDARFIYEGLDAAKSLLATVNTFVDPEESLRFVPLRFYLYSIYAGVFLYHARCVGVLAADEEQSVRFMVKDTVNRLERSAIGTQHPGKRYSQLLRLLWDKIERREQDTTNSSTASLQYPYRPTNQDLGAARSVASSTNPTEESSTMAEMMGDFSWTDLDAIGNFAVNGNGGTVGDAEWWSGFLPTETGFMYDPLSGADDWSVPDAIKYSKLYLPPDQMR